jgi:NhaP-type Na+/H+ or K+/H+ antiporter
MPARESRAKLLWIRLATALALLAGAVYLGWRALETVNLSIWWLAVPLLLLEGHALLGLLCTPPASGTCTR